MNRIQLYLVNLIGITIAISSAVTYGQNASEAVPVAAVCAEIKADMQSINSKLASTMDASALSVDVGAITEKWRDRVGDYNKFCIGENNIDCHENSDNWKRKQLGTQIQYYLQVIDTVISNFSRDEFMTKVADFNNKNVLTIEQLCKE